MTDPTRFDALKKLPDEPAAKILARANAVLQTPLEAPASAPVGEVLAALDAKGALLDMLQLLAHALPPRQATWWACLSARDLLPAGAKMPSPITTAEAWVFQPSQETRLAAREALDTARNGDDTVLCAMAAAFADGTLGPGELEDYDAPPGAVGAAAFAMALKSLFQIADEETVARRGRALLERALDIARGGNGQAAPVPPPAVTGADRLAGETTT